MKNKRQYLLVGSFVLVGLALIVAILLWFSASNRKNYDVYRITFHEAVDGISTSSPVKYNGVEVGKVKAIELDNADPRNIYVYINVNQGLNITTATYASIKPQGVTGMSYVALSLTSSSSFTVIKPHDSPPYPEIPSRPSFLSSLAEQAQSVSTNIQDISVDIKGLLSDKNVNHVSNIVANIDRMTTALAKQSSSLGDIVVKVSKVLNNVDNNTQHLDQAITELSALSKSLQQNSVSLDKVLNTVQDSTLRNIDTVLLPNLNQTISNMNFATGQFNELITTLNQNPSALVRGKSAPVAGPGE